MPENEHDQCKVLAWSTSQTLKKACPYCCAEQHEKHHPECELREDEGFGIRTSRLIDSEKMHLWLQGFFDSLKNIRTADTVHYLLGHNAGNKMQSQQAA